MEILTEVVYFGSLSRELGETHSRLALRGPTPLREFLNHLPIQPGRVKLIMVNHRAVPPDQIVQPGDRVALFPREYAIFADWKDLRL